MATSKHKRMVGTLLQQEKWDEARTLIEHELLKQPENHWLLTQLGVTYYEQGRYREALRPLLASLDIVVNCPLTLWNLAGVVDAIGRPEAAVPIYTWLLASRMSADTDPCWESAEWAEALKTDCVYRIGLCFEHLKRLQPAEDCFRQYINLLLAGAGGTYPIDEVAKRILKLRSQAKQIVGKDVRDAIDLTLRASGIPSLSLHGGDQAPPKLLLADLLAT